MIGSSVRRRAHSSIQSKLECGLEERCRYVAADMFEEVPTEADVYSLKMILHDWNESECKRILQTIRRRAKPGGRIFNVEHIVPGPSESHFSKLFDIHMIVLGQRPGTAKARPLQITEKRTLRDIDGTEIPVIGSWSKSIKGYVRRSA